ncbi:TadE family protein [Micromonospora echinofusca]|uniref:Pilus assembly protein n=1 Tax=Micromonospora echinofusca TaxID=47858 RepID=A0ABS3VUP0_MICEH|nr:TadE family protein [Micromonospora echinofusca]MBO4208231.1 pilus assembly protein [Micromonospora echinofusca]
MSPVERGPVERFPADRGSVAVEVAILVPAFLMLIVLAAVVGRTAIAQNAVDLAAHDAARAASISRTMTTARAEGETQALAQVRRQGLRCDYLTVTLAGIDGANRRISLAAAFDTPVGTPVSITSHVVCDVSLRDLFGAPSPTRRVEAWFVSPMDRYRPRSAT